MNRLCSQKTSANIHLSFIVRRKNCLNDWSKHCCEIRLNEIVTWLATIVSISSIIWKSLAAISCSKESVGIEKNVVNNFKNRLCQIEIWWIEVMSLIERVSDYGCMRVIFLRVFHGKANNWALWMIELIGIFEKNWNILGLILAWHGKNAMAFDERSLPIHLPPSIPN